MSAFKLIAAEKANHPIGRCGNAYEPPREPELEPHITTTRPGELVGIDCFFVGRLSGATHRDRALVLDGSGDAWFLGGWAVLRAGRAAELVFGLH